MNCHLKKKKNHGLENAHIGLNKLSVDHTAAASGFVTTEWLQTFPFSSWYLWPASLLAFSSLALYLGGNLCIAITLGVGIFCSLTKEELILSGWCFGRKLVI